MSYRLQKAAVHSKAKRTAQHVLTVMADAIFDKKVTEDKGMLTAPCNTSKEYLADKTGYSVNTISRALKELRELGLITFDPKRKVATGYDISIPMCAKNPKSNQSKVDQNGEPSTNEVDQNGGEVDQNGGEVDQNGGEVDQNGEHNRVSNKEDNNKESNKQASNSIVSNNIEIPTPQTEKPKMQTTPHAPTPQATPLPACPAAACSEFTLKEIALAALAKLVADGIEEPSAKAMLSAVSKDFKADWKELKANGFAGITKPKAYLTAKLVGMAKEGPKQSTPQAEEPTRLEEIFELLKTEWATQYPEVADRIKSFEIIDLHPSTESRLRAKEDADWKTVKGSRIAYVRSTLEGTVFERVQSWRKDALKETGNFMQTLKGQLAQLRSFPNVYYHPTIPLEDHLKELEGKLARAKEEYQRLRMSTTRHNAA